MIETLRRLLAGLAMVGFFSGCPGPNPPPIPTPTPSPTVSPTTPPKGTPVTPEVLLRPDGVRIKTLEGQPVNAFMAVQCCMPFLPLPAGIEVNSRWPLASEAWMDYTGARGANMFHFRMGPFKGEQDWEREWADVGGAYLPGTLDWNPGFWNVVRDLTYHASKKGAWVEVVVVDTWGCKVSKRGTDYTPWPPDAIQACGTSPHPEIERFIRKVVEELGCFGNVIWSTDNEGGLVPGANPDFYLWVRDTIRDEESKTGCAFVHMIGTNSGFPEVQGQVDFVVTHERAALRAPIAGRWTLNNERNPSFTPEMEVTNFKYARNLGLAYALWRNGMNDQDFERTLDLFQKATVPSPSECYAPQADDPNWVNPPIGAPDRPCQRCQEIDRAKATVGDRCGKNIQESLALVAGALRAEGLCATGPWSDAVAVQAPDGMFEEHHVIAYTNGCYTQTSNGYKNAWKFAGGADACYPPLPPKFHRFALKRHQNKNDATGLVPNENNYCSQVGFEGRAECPVRQEGDPQRGPCEEVACGGFPIWRTSPAGDVEVLENPYQARCSNCTFLEVCTSDGTACSRCRIDPTTGYCAEN